MSELIVRSHNFEMAKNKIKAFAETLPDNVEFEKVDDSKGMGEFLGDWFLGRGIGLKHEVTGEELNELIDKIQNHFIRINTTQVNLTHEFKEVYNAMEALDKDYIQAILVSIKATEETSNGIKAQQEQINKIVGYQKKTLEKLEKFKLKLDEYKHLEDVDQIWDDCQHWYHEVQILSDTMYNFMRELKKIEHLNDVDVMWEVLSLAQESIQDISTRIDKLGWDIEKNREDIDSLLNYADKLSKVDHLMDIDSIWEQTKNQEIKIKELEFTGEKSMQELKSTMRQNKEENDDKILTLREEHDTAIETLGKRVKYAYLIAGGSVGLAIIELLLLLTKVM